MKMAFVTITVRNLRESLVFYKEVIGLEEITRFSPQSGMTIVFLKDKDNNKLELIEHENMKSERIKEHNSIVSIGYNVENLEKVIELLNDRMIKIIQGPTQVAGGARLLLIEDPNGVGISFIEGFDL